MHFIQSHEAMRKNHCVTKQNYGLTENYYYYVCFFASLEANAVIYHFLNTKKKKKKIGGFSFRITVSLYNEINLAEKSFKVNCELLFPHC